MRDRGRKWEKILDRILSLYEKKSQHMNWYIQLEKVWRSMIKHTCQGTWWTWPTHIIENVILNVMSHFISNITAQLNKEITFYYSIILVQIRAITRGIKTQTTNELFYMHFSIAEVHFHIPISWMLESSLLLVDGDYSTWSGLFPIVFP